MADKIKLRNGTAAAWVSADPTLLLGERGLETDTRKAKTGDGSTAWVSLPYDDYPKVSAKSGSYTILDDDSDFFDVTTGAVGDTLTLPTLADNQDRIIGVRKADSAAGSLTLDGEGAEEIDGRASLVVYTQGGLILVRGGANEWEVIALTGGEPVTNAKRVVAEYIFDEDSELDYTGSFTDGMAAATITITELPVNTVAIKVLLDIGDTSNAPIFSWKRTAGGTLVLSEFVTFADGGTNRFVRVVWMPTGGNSLRVTNVTADTNLDFKILGYQVGE